MVPDSTMHADFPETDPQALERLRRFGGDKLLGDMIILFLEAVPQRLGAARSGLARGEAHAVEHELHALKSSAAQLGALRMHRLSQEGERLAKTETLDGLVRILDELDAEEPRVREWLTAARTRASA
jgi:HPt (histidine-containing phosphotransfer) domain-containing protein